jgi:hypothetical protein
MNATSIFLIVFGIVLVGMGLLARKWKQVTWTRQALVGSILVVAGIWWAVIH